MPPPEHFREYNEVLPGAAERLMALVERQQAHRHAIEGKMVDSDVRRTSLGMWMGLTIVVLALAAGTALAWNDKQLIGGLLAGGPLVALVSVFLYGADVRRKERQARATTLSGR